MTHRKSLIVAANKFDKKTKMAREAKPDIKQFKVLSVSSIPVTFSKKTPPWASPVTFSK